MSVGFLLQKGDEKIYRSFSVERFFRENFEPLISEYSKEFPQLILVGLGGLTITENNVTSVIKELEKLQVFVKEKFPETLGEFYVDRIAVILGYLREVATSSDFEGFLG